MLSVLRDVRHDADKHFPESCVQYAFVGASGFWQRNILATEITDDALQTQGYLDLFTIRTALWERRRIPCLFLYNQLRYIFV